MAGVQARGETNSDMKQPGKSSGASARGKFRHLAFCFLPLALFPVLAAEIRAGGGWLGVLIAGLLVVVPLLDWLTGWQDEAQFDGGDFTAAEIFLLNWNPRLYALGYLGFVFWLALHIGQSSRAEIVPLVVTMSLLGGIGFSAAHELLHGKARTDQVLQRIFTMFLFYPHYKLIHIRSHHVHTSTENDENTAWLNETIYAYIARTIPGSAIRCWQMEARQFGIWRNKMTWYAVAQAGLLAGMYLLVGWCGLAFYLAHTFGAHIVLESVNYIQHYGLLREKRADGYEKTAAEHSWDTYHFFSSYVAYRVGHHSYHHLAVKPYYLLASEPEAPKLPVGYFWAIAMVFLPPWWRRVMHPRLQAA